MHVAMSAATTAMYPQSLKWAGMRQQLRLLTGLNILDVILSALLISAPSGEANPLMSWLISQIGLLPGLILPKATLLCCMWSCLPLARRARALSLPWKGMLHAVNFFYLAVVCYSLALLLVRQI